MTSLSAHWQQLGLTDATSDSPMPTARAFPDDGVIPNNTLPVLIYRGTAGYRDAFEALFSATGWPAQWQGSVFAFQHYHSTAHEVLGVTAGEARLQLGGDNGEVMTLSAGDSLVIPAGVGHCRLSATPDFTVLGGYPSNQPDWDLCRADAAMHEAAQARIAQVPLPPSDPVTGIPGALTRFWGAYKAAPNQT